MSKLIPLSEVEDNQEFWSGSRFRLYEVGMNVKNKEDDYYEYMLIDDHGDHMIAANVSDKAGRYKAGFVIAHVKKLTNVDRHVVDGRALKYSLGEEHTFWVREE